MPLSAGDKLGPYVVTASIGAGGMGEVYKARDTRLEGRTSWFHAFHVLYPYAFSTSFVSRPRVRKLKLACGGAPLVNSRMLAVDIAGN